MKIAQLDHSQTPAVVVNTFDYGSDTPPASMTPPDYVDVTNVEPPPVRGFTYDGTTWAPGTPQQHEQNRQAIRAKAQAALTANQAFLGLASPTNAQVLAQVQSLTKQVNALARLILSQFDSTQGT